MVFFFLKALRDHEEQPRPDAMRGQGRPLVNYAASVEVEAPGLKGSEKEDEIWHHVAGS